MAPEQTNVGKVVLATDVWAVGLIVFNLLTGQSYWRTARTPGSTITALLVEIMVEALEPASVRAHEVAPSASLPPGFDAWFSRCLVRDPAQRHADAMAAFPPLLAMLSGIGQTQPVSALGETAAIASLPPRSGVTAPAALHASGPSPVAPTPAAESAMLAETQPGPQLQSGPQGWQSGPLAASAPGAMPATAPITSVSAPPTAPIATLGAQPPPRRIWPWVLLGTMGIGAMCSLGAVYQLVRGGEQIAHELATTAPQLQGHFVDPETGATLDLGPDGLHLRAGDGQALALASGALPDAGEEAEGEASEAASDEEAEGDESDEEAEGDDTDDDETGSDDDEADSGDEADSSDEADPSDERDDDASPRRRPTVGPIAQVVEGMERRRARREAREATGTTVEPAIHRAFRTQIVDPCWRGSYEGELAPPRRRYAIHVVGTSIRVEAPRQTSAEQTFVTCIVSRAPGQPSGDYVYVLP
jgi:hypothetical protein